MTSPAMPLQTAGLDPAIAQALGGVAQAIGALVQALGMAQPTTGAQLAGAPGTGTAPTVAGTAGGGPGPGSGVPVQSPTQVPKQSAGSSTAKVATFNVLGSSHTNASGNKPEYASGVQRVPDMIQQLKKHDVEIAGLQEFQGDQQRAFKAAKTGYDMVGEQDNAVVWKADRYRKVGQTSLTIPYFKGKPREMPAVQLEDIATGKRVWVLSVHNPADTKSNPGNAGNRREAERRERAFIAKLEATGVPVIVAGDFNDDKQSTSAMTQGGLTTVADPKGTARNIDWVFGSRGVRFGATTRDTDPRTDKTSDHPIVVTTATF